MSSCKYFFSTLVIITYQYHETLSQPTLTIAPQAKSLGQRLQGALRGIGAAVKGAIRDQMNKLATKQPPERTTKSVAANRGNQPSETIIGLDRLSSKEQLRRNCRIARCSTAFQNTVSMMHFLVATQTQQNSQGSASSQQIARDAVVSAKAENGMIQISKSDGTVWVGQSKSASNSNAKGTTPRPSSKASSDVSFTWTNSGSNNNWNQWATNWNNLMASNNGALTANNWQNLMAFDWTGSSSAGASAKRQTASGGGRGGAKGSSRVGANGNAMSFETLMNGGGGFMMLDSAGIGGRGGRGGGANRRSQTIMFTQAQNYGDPHTISFDGRMITTQGTCKQILTRFVNRRGRPDIPSFTVFGKNRQNRRRQESFPLFAEIEVYGRTFILGPGGVLTVNGHETATPYILPEAGSCETPCRVFLESEVVTQTSLRRRNLDPNIRLSLKTGFGLHVTFRGDGESNGAININPPPATKGHLEGLSGNWDGTTENDLTMPNGTTAANDNDSATSWMVNDPQDPKCVLANAVPEPRPCPPAQQRIADRTCAMLTDRNSVFRDCLADPNLRTAAESFRQACIFDICATTDQDFAIAAMEEFSERCEEALELETEITWQETLRTYLSNAVVSSSATSSSNKHCSENMHFLSNAEATPTCENPVLVLELNASNAEGACVCTGGNLFEPRTMRCINAEQCGCRDASGVMHEVGDSWLSTDCRIQHTCNDDRTFSDATFQCPRETVCGTEEGHSACVCRPGFRRRGATCVAVRQQGKQQATKQSSTKDQQSPKHKAQSLT